MKELRNVVAWQLIKEGRPQREALAIVTDPRRQAELERLLKAAGYSKAA